MKRYIWLIVNLFTVSTILSPELTFAQTNDNQINSEEVKSYYQNYFKADPRLISGDFYQTPVMSNSTGDPYFIDANWKDGSVIINDLEFQNLQLRYDISSHQIILNTLNQTDSYLQIALKKEQISEFVMNGRIFRPYPSDDPVYGRRFAEVIVQGDINFLVVKSKNLKVTEGGVSDYMYQTSTRKSIQIGEQLLPYRGVKTLKKEFPELKVQLKQFTKSNHLRFRKLQLDQHASIIEHCNSLLEKPE
jgi:hypothetical protein